jgi:hypothetical protein
MFFLVSLERENLKFLFLSYPLFGYKAGEAEIAFVSQINQSQ